MIIWTTTTTRKEDSEAMCKWNGRQSFFKGLAGTRDRSCKILFHSKTMYCSISCVVSCETWDLEVSSGACSTFNSKQPQQQFICPNTPCNVSIKMRTELNECVIIYLLGMNGRSKYGIGCAFGINSFLNLLNSSSSATFCCSFLSALYCSIRLNFSATWYNETTTNHEAELLRFILKPETYMSLKYWMNVIIARSFYLVVKFCTLHCSNV